MEREWLLALLWAGLGILTTWLLATLLYRLPLRVTTAAEEPRRWWRLWGPLAGAILVLAFWLGWACREPDPSDEVAGPLLWICTGIALLVVCRATVRAVAALLSARHAGELPVGTLGILRPRVVCTERFRDTVPSAVYDAALAHEAAHAKGWDPLRIWLAQIAGDLQWPLPGARQRFSSWLLALELRRDQEAVAQGGSPLDLAAAIVAAARMSTGCAGVSPGATLHGRGGVELRVRQLLDQGPGPGQRAEIRSRAWRAAAALVAVSCGAAAMGAVWGEAVLRWLPVVGP